MELLQSWDTNWEGQFTIQLVDDTLGWQLQIHFDTQVSSIQVCVCVLACVCVFGSITRNLVLKTLLWKLTNVLTVKRNTRETQSTL